MQDDFVDTNSILFGWTTNCIIYPSLLTLSVYLLSKITDCIWNEMLFQLDFQQINVKCWKSSLKPFTNRNIYPVCRFYSNLYNEIVEEKHWFSVETTVFQAIFAAENSYIRRFADPAFAYVNTFQQFQPSDCWNLKG